MTDDDPVAGRIDVGDRAVTYRIEYGDVTYARLSIEPDGTVLVRAPNDMDDTRRIITSNRLWIERQLDTRLAAAGECGVDDPETAPILFGREFALNRNASHTEIRSEDATVGVPADTGLSDPSLESQVREALLEKWDAIVTEVAATLEIPADETRLDGGLDSWSDHAPDGTVLVHPRAGILPSDLLEHLAFRELVFYKEESNNRSYWGDVVERYPEHTALSERLLGYWLLSHANDFWNAVIEG